jgi:MFS family permease
VAAPATRRLEVARAVRAFADGFASVLLARYLQDLGFDAFQIGVIVTATLLGSATLTLWAGLRLGRLGARSVLLASCALMATTGIGFAAVTRFWPLVIVGFIGTLNPSGGDVSLFLPMEQTALANLTTEQERPHRFAIYNLGAALAAAAGAVEAVGGPHALVPSPDGFDVPSDEEPPPGPPSELARRLADRAGELLDAGAGGAATVILRRAAALAPGDAAVAAMLARVTATRVA